MVGIVVKGIGKDNEMNMVVVLDVLDSIVDTDETVVVIRRIFKVLGFIVDNMDTDNDFNDNILNMVLVKVIQDADNVSNV